MDRLARPGAERPIGRTGLVTHPVGLDGSVFGWVADHAQAGAILDDFVAGGGTLVSTADHYAGGRSEIMIGSWLRRSGLRDRVIVASKAGLHPDAPGHSATSLIRAVEASLERLGTDTIDLLSLDSPDAAIPYDETLAAAESLVASGKIRFLGTSAFGADDLRALDAAATARGGGLCAEVVLGVYNLLERQRFEQEIAPVVDEHGSGFLGRLPLAEGFLSGELRRRGDPPSSPLFADAEKHIGRRGNRVLAEIDSIATEAATDAATVAIAWVLGKPLVDAVLVRPVDPAAVHRLLPAVDFRLTDEQEARLDRVSEHRFLDQRFFEH